MNSKNNNVPVSVLMPTFNAGKTLAETVRSVLDQSFRNFEFVIIDDGSTDNTEEVLSGFHDERLRFIRNPANIGIARTLNDGVMHCRGDYICRIDADDLFHKNKIAIQYRFMEQHKDCIVSGTHFRKLKDNKLLKWHSKHFLHVSNAAIRVEMLRNSPLCHPSVMFRKYLFAELGLRYDPEAMHYEDYELWHQASKHGRLHIINRPLLYYRVHSEQISTKHALLQCTGANKIREKLIRVLCPDITTDELRIHLALMTDLNPGAGIAEQDVNAWIVKICALNSRRKIYDTRIFNRMIKHRGKRLFRSG